jgi:hypothetical protein
VNPNTNSAVVLIATNKHVRDLIHYQLEIHDGRWHLQFKFDHQALEQLMANRLGRTVLLTNHLDWTPEQVVTAYSGQQHIEQISRGLKDGDWLGWGPMHHWTDQKIRVHAFYCMLGISLLQYVSVAVKKGPFWQDKRDQYCGYAMVSGSRIRFLVGDLSFRRSGSRALLTSQRSRTFL